MEIVVTVALFFIIFFGGVIAVSGVFDEKKCPLCGTYELSRHMLKDKNGKYWHPQCFPLEKSE